MSTSDVGEMQYPSLTRLICPNRQLSCDTHRLENYINYQNELPEYIFFNSIKFQHNNLGPLK